MARGDCGAQGSGRRASTKAGLTSHRRRRARCRAADDSADVRAAFNRLPAKAREILLLRYFLRLSEEETAAALDLRLGTVKSRTARARRLLLGELE